MILAYNCSLSHLLCEKLFLQFYEYFQALETNNAGWMTLFEPFPFFEAYKNYLQIDIAAENDDDLRKWKGWIESRLRQLTLKVTSVFPFHNLTITTTII